VVAFEFFSEAALQKVIANTGLQRPFATVSEYYVVCEVEKKNELEEETLMQVFESCLEQGYIADGALAQSEAQAKSFWRLREDISESLAKYSPYKNDISVRISKVPSLVQELDVLLKTAYPTWEVIWFGHIGDGNLHINILRPENMIKEEFVRECRTVDPLVFAEIQKFAGSISAEHGVGLSKKSFLC
jgi:FAD/FMN-containing dehydrogenase